MLDERLHAAERFRAREDAAGLEEVPGAGEAALDHEADHSTEASLLSPGEIVLGVTRQAGIDHPRDISAALEPDGDGAGVLFMALHPHVQRLDAAQHEKAIHRRWHGADGVLQE